MVVNKVLGLIFLCLGYVLTKYGVKHKIDDSWDILSKCRSIIVGVLFIFTGLFLLITSEELF